MCDYNTCCRLCLHEAKDGLNCLNVPRFIVAIRQIFGFEIAAKDKSSTKICQECMGKITNISMYRDFVLNNQTTIKDYQIFRSNIQTLKNETIISDEDDVIFLDEDKPTEEPSNIRTKILTKQKQTARKRTGAPFPKVDSPIKLKKVRVVCERIDFNTDIKKIIVTHKKHDVLQATSEKESVNRLKIIKTVAMGKKGQMTTYKVLGANTKPIDEKNNENILKHTKKNNRKSVEINHTKSISEKQPESPSNVLIQTECGNNITTKSVNTSRRLSEKDKELLPTNTSTNNSSPYIGINKTVNETPQSPVDSNSIRKEVKQQIATIVSTDNNRSSITKCITLNEIFQSSDVDSKKEKEQSATNISSNYNGENIGISKTVETKSVPQKNTSVILNQEPKVLPQSLNIHLVNKTTIDSEKKIGKCLPTNVLPTKKQKLEINSAPASTQNTSQRTGLNSVAPETSALSISKASPSAPITKPATIVHALPLTPFLKSTASQTHSINPSKILIRSNKICAASTYQQNQKITGPIIPTNTNVDSEYVSLETFGRQCGSTQASIIRMPSSSTTTSYSKQEKPLQPRFDRLYQQQTGGPKIKSVAPDNITSPGIRPMNNVEGLQMPRNLNTQQNSNKVHITSSALNSNKVKVLTVNQVNNSYLFKPALSTVSAVKTVHLPYTNTGSTSYNSNATTSYNSTAPAMNFTAPPTNFTAPATNSTAQTMYRKTTAPNVKTYQSQFQSAMFNKNMEKIRLPAWNRNATQNSPAVPNLNYSQTQETNKNPLTFSIRLIRFNNEIQIKISNKNEEIYFNNMNKNELDAVRKSILQPSSIAQICKAFKIYKPDAYSKDLLKKLDIESYFFKI